MAPRITGLVRTRVHHPLGPNLDASEHPAHHREVAEFEEDQRKIAEPGDSQA
jgi:hypothetical protein